MQKFLFMSFTAVALILAGCVDRTVIYERAVKAAALPGPDAVAKLRPIPEGAEQIDVVTWTGWDGYVPGQSQSLEQAVWVTAVPQVQEICQSLANGTSTDRLEELLGLKPGGGNGRFFITMKVNTEDMFRPCADTSIYGDTCPMEMPNAPPEGVTQDQWLEDLQLMTAQMLSTYRAGLDGIPFTRLGYTYDWSATAARPVGPSEYIVRAGAEIFVTDRSDNTAYCAPPSG